MTVYAWPVAWQPSRFEMRVQPNTRVFVGPYTPTTQVVDLLGERWVFSIDLPPPLTTRDGAAREAYFDRLKGPANLIAMSHLKRPQPLGSLREGGGSAQWKTASGANATWQTASAAPAAWSYGSPVVYAAVPQGSNVVPLCRTPGETLFAGDHFGAGGQLFRAMADAVADSAGRMAVEVQPRVRVALSLGAAVTCTSPTANCILKADGVPTVWRVGGADGTSLELIEAL